MEVLPGVVVYMEGELCIWKRCGVRTAVLPCCMVSAGGTEITRISGM